MHHKAITYVVRGGPLHRENKKIFRGSDAKVSVDASLERLKVICCWEDGQEETVSRSRGDNLMMMMMIMMMF